MANIKDPSIEYPPAAPGAGPAAAIIGAGRRAAEALAAANAGLNPANPAARADIALAVAEIADFLERNAASLRALDARAAAGARMALARDATRFCVESILSVDQFAELDAGVVDALRALYADFVARALDFSSVEEAADALPSLIIAHRRRMAAILAPVRGLLPPASVARREPLVCAEYSSVLQTEILALDEGELLEPVLDVGCGRHARLVRHLRSRGIEAYGIERFPLSEEARSDGLGESAVIARDWNEYDFLSGRWGTILSHLAFSNHFARHAARAEGRDLDYAKKYRELLESLRRGGTFRYAPSLPFVERHLDPNVYAVSIREFGPAGFPFTATVIRRQGVKE